MKKQEILRIYAWKDEETGEVGADWNFPQKVGTFAMLGILQTIMHDLNVMQSESEREE